MDKATMKAVFQAHGLPVVEHLVVTRHEWRTAPDRLARRVAETIGFPCFVKPSNLGSSVGISHVRDAGALPRDRKSTRLNSSHSQISYAVFCLKKKRHEESRRPSPFR